MESSSSDDSSDDSSEQEEQEESQGDEEEEDEEESQGDEEGQEHATDPEHAPLRWLSGRATAMRHASRRSRAPASLRRLVASLRDSERRLGQSRSELRAFAASLASRRVMARRRVLLRRRHLAHGRVERQRRRLALYEHPSIDLPSPRRFLQGARG